jgi:Tol biopolymer transport system component
MKRCPECRRDYHDDSLLYCLDDGSALLDGPATGDHDEPMTAKMVIPARPSLGGSESPTGAIAAEHISRELKGHKFRSGAIILIVLVVLTGFAYGLYKFFDRPSGAPQRTSASINVQKLTGDGRTRMPVISPDGKFLVYAKLEGGQESLWIKQIQTGSSVNVVKPGESDEFWAITFSPDGNFVYYNAGGRRSSKEPPTVFRVPTLGGTPTKFLSNAYFVQFSTDGKQISFRRPDLPQGEKIFIANADGSQEREIYSVGGMQYFSTAPAWSPDGKYLSIAVGDDALVPNPSVQARLISVADGSAKALGERKVEVLDDMVWHPSGDSLIAVAQMDASSATTQLWEVSYPLGEYRKLSNDVNGYTGVSITGDGSSIVTGELYARSSIWVSPDLKPENAKQIMPAASDTWGIAWTPDGQIVYSSDQTGEPQIWIVNADGTNAKPFDRR